MIYEEYISLGSEDRMRARLNDLALAAARQEPVETKVTDVNHMQDLPKFLPTAGRRPKAGGAPAKVIWRDQDGNVFVIPSDMPGTGGQPAIDWMERMSQQVGVDVATFERVIEAYENLGTDQKK